jgi:peptide/nickel transport system permease protein
MAKYLATRLLSMMVALVGILLIVFLLIHMIPGDPVDIMLGEAALAADKENLRKLLGLDQNLVQQFLNFLTSVFNGTWGLSFAHQKPVLGLILERFPATLTLALSGLSVGLLIAIPLGTLAAGQRGKLFDSLSMMIALIGMSIPIFVVAPLAVLYFSIELKWLPVAGYGSFRHLILPSLCLGFGLSGFLSRLLRSSLLEVFQEDYIRTARSKGLSWPAIVFRHAYKNAAIPVVTVIGNMLGGLLAGAVLTETLFDWPGIGKLFFSAFQSRDFPLIQGVVLWISCSYLIINFLMDGVYSWIDPRIRLRDGFGK